MPNRIIYGLIQDILKYFNFSRSSNFGVQKLQKCIFSIECFIYRKVNILEHLNIVFLKGDIKTKISSTEQSLSNIRGLRNLYIKKVNFIMGHPVGNKVNKGMCITIEWSKYEIKRLKLSFLFQDLFLKEKYVLKKKICFKDENWQKL